MASKPNRMRASGETQVEEVTKAESSKNDKADSLGESPVGSDSSPMGIFSSTGLSRMKLEWGGEDAQSIIRAQAAVNDRMMSSFRDAYQLMHDIFVLVREPEVDPSTGEVLVDSHGWPKWKRTISGGWEEDWSRLTRKQKENFLFQITTRLFAWEMSAAESWGEAMFAKAQWEERFAVSYDAPVTGTISDRTARGRMGASDDRVFAIFLTLYSKKAEAVVRTMTLLAQRLKDTLEIG